MCPVSWEEEGQTQGEAHLGWGQSITTLSSAPQNSSGTHSHQTWPL